MAGLKYGQYVSAYDIRAAANPSDSAAAAQAHQLLIGSGLDPKDQQNDIAAAARLKLRYSQYADKHHAALSRCRMGQPLYSGTLEPARPTPPRTCRGSRR